MKKRRIIKSIFASMLAIIMVLSLTSIVSAVDTATLTINNTVDGKTVDLYQVFSATKNATTNAVSYTLNAKYENFFKSNDKYGCTDESNINLSDAAYKYVSGLSDSGAQITFRNEILQWISKENVLPTNTVTTTDNSTSVNNLSYGYYLIAPKSTDIEWAAMMMNIVTNDTQINIKSTLPIVDKKSDGKDNISAKIGDVIPFTLTSHVPDMSNYTSYTFKFIDTLSKGLTFNNDSVVITINGKTIASSGYDVVSNSVTNGSEVTITLNDFKTNYGKFTGTPIVVTYTATLNENASVGMDYNTNKAVVEYSNNPDVSTETGQSTPDVVPVFSFDFNIFKFHTDNTQKMPLSGAKFKLYKSQECTAENEIKLKQDGDNYVVSLSDETGVEATSSAEGNIYIKGLSAGTYYLKETVAPDGYNILSAPVEFKIEYTYDENGTLAYSLIHGEETSIRNNKEGNVPTINIENKSGSLLPDTGGMGTVIFTVGGLAIIGIMVGFSVMSKKKKKM